MDPTSQDNSFGSFGPGGNNPGVGGGVPPVGGVANNPMAPTGLEQMGEMGQSSQTNQMWQTSQMNQMGMAPAVVSSDSGDVVIGGDGERKRGKKKIIALCAVIVIIVAIGVFLAFMLKQKKIDERIGESWNNYYRVLSFGDEERDGNMKAEESGQNISTSVNDWYSVRTIDIKSKEEHDEYFASLKASFTDFYDNAEKKISDIKNYSDAFYAFYNYNMLDELEGNLLTVFKNQGEKSAKEYINTLTSNVIYVENLDNYLRNYLMTKLYIIQVYDSNGCYDDKDEEMCVMGVIDDKVDHYYYLQQRNYGLMKNYFSKFFLMSFSDDTKKMNNSIGGNNEK